MARNEEEGLPIKRSNTTKIPWYERSIFSSFNQCRYANGEMKVDVSVTTLMQPFIHHLLPIVLVVLSLIGILLCGIYVFPPLAWEAWFAMISVIIAFGVMMSDVCSPTLVFFWLIGLYTATKVINIEQAISGFCNSSVITIAFLFVVASALEETGAMYYISKFVLGSPRSYTTGMMRLLIPVCVLSGFINNTPLVALMIPACQVWSHKTGIPVSKMLMPLSFATILGGTLTNIGTSTNLVVIGLAKDYYPGLHVGFFDVAIPGVPCALVGLTYLIIIGRFLPVRQNIAVEYLNKPQEFTFTVKAGPQLNGREVSTLQDMRDLYLFEIERNGEIIPAPASNTALCENDLLKFTGHVTEAHVLFSRPGILPVSNYEKVSGTPSSRVLVEAILPIRSPIIGHTARQCKFRMTYDAAIIAVSRFGERIGSNISEIVFEPGDSLLLEAGPRFIEEFSTDRSHFNFCSMIGDGLSSRKPQNLALIFVVTCVVVMIALNVAEIAELFILACLLFVTFVTLGIVTWRKALMKMQGEILLQIATAFVLGSALTTTGVAQLVGDQLVLLFQKGGSFGVLYGCYVTTAIFTAILTNAAAAAVVLPITVSFVASELVKPKAVVIVVMLASSCDFMTSIGYQTNIMVCGPAGYTFSDFTKWGTGLTFIVSIVGTLFTLFAYNY